MSYLDPPAEPSELARRQFEAEQARFGFVPNFVKLFALMPEAYEAWGRLNTAVKRSMDLRRYELVTLAAARRRRSSYCSLAHGTVLRNGFYDAEALERIAADHHDAGLDAVDVALMDFAGKAATDPTTVTAEDVDELRRHGLTDADIFSVVLAVAARCFLTTVIDSIGAEPDRQYRTILEPALQRVLAVGRPIEKAD
jgi:uncharacterized peroxidase-related enzyme